MKNHYKKYIKIFSTNTEVKTGVLKLLGCLIKSFSKDLYFFYREDINKETIHIRKSFIKGLKKVKFFVDLLPSEEIRYNFLSEYLDKLINRLNLDDSEKDFYLNNINLINSEVNMFLISKNLLK